ncbi:MAG: hypothetical protein Q7K57_43305 [Burkholderiaceae bacterium]|nr:hypothetical protein [Burkholderiaceae bacterium]
MNERKEVGRMILADLQLFNQAVVIFGEECEPEIWDHFSMAIQEWTHENGWSCVLNKDITGNWFSPPEWSHKGDKGCNDANLGFVIDLDASPSYFVADLCGIGSAPVGLWFWVTEKALGFENKKAWKKSLQMVAEKYATRLKPLGFVYDELGFYLPLSLDPRKLADAWVDNSYEELFEPLVAALDKLKASTPIFNEMLAEMGANQR